MSFSTQNYVLFFGKCTIPRQIMYFVEKPASLLLNASLALGLSLGLALSVAPCSEGTFFDILGGDARQRSRVGEDRQNHPQLRHFSLLCGHN